MSRLCVSVPQKKRGRCEKLMLNKYDIKARYGMFRDDNGCYTKNLRVGDVFRYGNIVKTYRDESDIPPGCKVVNNTGYRNNLWLKQLTDEYYAERKRTDGDVAVKEDDATISKLSYRRRDSLYTISGNEWLKHFDI